MKAELVPIYEDIFTDEPVPKIIDLIRSAPSEVFIKSCGYINSKLYNAKNPFEEEKQIFIHLIERTKDDGLKNKYYKNLLKFIKETENKRVGIFPLPHTLKLAELALLNFIPGTFNDISAEQELNILKILLLLNSQANEKFANSFRTSNLSQTESHYKIFWSNLLFNSTVLIRKDLVISIYKSLKFLSFLDNNYKKYLSEYTRQNKVDTYQKIPIKLFELYNNGQRPGSDAFFFSFTEELIENNTVIKALSIDVANYSKEEFLEKNFDKNFKGLRTFPIFKCSKEYIITNWNFIIEKFYEGLVFDFYNKTNIREEEELNSFENYKNKIGDYFTNNFFMETMKEMFSQKGIIALKEKERNSKCNYDFYIRIRNQVFFFEFKDILFPIKETYNEIKKTLDTKLTDKKGIKQLVNHIESFTKQPDVYDDLHEAGITIENWIIYPIIVYSDSAYGLTGVNTYLDSLFQLEVKSRINDSMISIRPLAMISFDFFLKQYENFKKQKLDIVEVLHSYYQLHQLRRAIHLKNKGDVEAMHNAYEGFDSIISEKVPYHPKDILESSVFEYVLDEIKPHLPN